MSALAEQVVWLANDVHSGHAEKKDGADAAGRQTILMANVTPSGLDRAVGCRPCFSHGSLRQSLCAA